MSTYGWIFTFLSPVPPIIIFLYVMRRELLLVRKTTFAISIYTLTLLSIFVVGFMNIIRSELHVVVLGVIVSSIVSYFLATYLRNRQLSHQSHASGPKPGGSPESTNGIHASNALPKWLGGILATIIGGVFLWWLTQSEIAPFKGGPNLKITSFRLPEAIYVGERTYAEITVYNEGSRTAEGCRLTWYPLSRVGPHGSEGTFGVPPQQSGKGRAWITFKNGGDITTMYGITGCDAGISPEDRSWYPERKVRVLKAR